MNNPVIAFIGAGQMAEAIFIGLLDNNYTREQILCLDTNPERLKYINQRHQLKTTDDLSAAIEVADICLLAVKPFHIAGVCASLRACATPLQNKLFISIAAGVDTSLIATAFGQPVNLIRAMPNLAIEVGLGLTALYAATDCLDEHKLEAERIFTGGGQVLWLDKEDDMHLVTAVSGSGPGFVFYLLEEMIQAVINSGMSPQAATEMVLATVNGAATMAARADTGPAQLRERVSSAGGTTAHGLELMRQAGLSKLFEAVFQRAAQRSRELSKEFASDLNT